MAHANLRARNKVGFKHLEAPLSSLEPPYMTTITSLTIPRRCAICLHGDPTLEMMVQCERCTKEYHEGCHIPALTLQADGNPDLVFVDVERYWQCNWCKDQSRLKSELETWAIYREKATTKALRLQGNKRGYTWAAKFVTDTFQLRGTRAIRWKFPFEYLEKFGKVPFNLNYIRQRMADPRKPFKSIGDMLRAYRQMLNQAAHYYRPMPQAEKEDPMQYFQAFRNLVEFYYPRNKDIFYGINFSN